MRKALATFGWGAAAPLLDVAFPTFRDYADRHGYDLIVSSRRWDRSPQWCKIPLLKELLGSYDFVVWIDADSLILDASIDLAAVVPDDAYQALAVVSGGEEVGEGPSTGLWVLRAGPRANELLDAIWSQEDLINHAGLWEQSALMRLMGWTLRPPYVKMRASEWDAGTHVLGEEWNALPIHPIGYRPARIRHYAAMPYPHRLYDMQTDRALLTGRWPRYWLGRLERRLYRNVASLLSDYPLIHSSARWLTAKLRLGPTRS